MPLDFEYRETPLHETVEYLLAEGKAGKLRRNLAQKDVAEPVIEQVIARLEDYGYVDDLAFARFWVTNRDSFKPKGPLALRQELREKGEVAKSKELPSMAVLLAALISLSLFGLTPPSTCATFSSLKQRTT